ncbi:allantoinase AllB [Geodermatophilus sp. YIM 151500]|uniref:allantoinase AllB n=1 Tax=Geodermatophilus sp. YIM 151500 TaxID=2984531 RepID=UPI0021E3851A|nr:allantoinase AllB [Geodermatophilus sp. YIM 151500]MCV2487741.1 allantoinase AllB [Geodermatophilus sp. YIM 151500]
MTEFDLVVRAARAVTGDGEEGLCVGVRDGRIAAVAPRDAELTGARVVDLAPDEVLLPGLVDTHVHVNEPGRTEWEGFETATRAAAAGGVTTIVDMPLNSIPPTVDVAALETKRKAADGKCAVDVGFWGGAVPGNIGELRGLHEAGVFGFKCFLLDSGVEEFPPLSPAELEHYLAEVASFGGLMIVHAEDAGEIERAPHRGGGRYGDFLRSRPPSAESRAVETVLQAARRTGARTHVLHLSSADALPALRAARAEGLPVTVETCPHYLSFDAETIGEGATQFKCCPPIREAANRELLWDALVAGDIDCVVSDHSPSTAELKLLDVGDFERAWGGVSSLQIGLPAMWSGARARGRTLADVVRWMAEGPARLAGLRTKGRLAVGCDADFCVFAPDEAFVVDPARLHHRNPVTPYAGRRLDGVVRSTWLRGRPVDAADPHGRFLVRGAA